PSGRRATPPPPPAAPLGRPPRAAPPPSPGRALAAAPGAEWLGPGQALLLGSALQDRRGSRTPRPQDCLAATLAGLVWAGPIDGRPGPRALLEPCHRTAAHGPRPEAAAGRVQGAQGALQVHGERRHPGGDRGEPPP